MDERISDNRARGSEIPQQPPPQKTSDILFDQILNYYPLKVRKEQLQTILQVAGQIRDESLSFRTPAGQPFRQPARILASTLPSTPDDLIQKAILKNFESNIAILNLLDNFITQMKKGPPFNKDATDNLKELLNASNMSPQAMISLQKNLSSFLNFQGQGNTPVGELVLLTSLLSYSKTQGAPSASQEQLLSELSKLAGQTPPGPFSTFAKNLLSQIENMSSGQIQQFLTQSANQANNSLSQLLIEVSRNPSLLGQIQNSATQLRAQSSQSERVRAESNFKSAQNSVKVELQDLINLLQQLQADGVNVSTMMQQAETALKDYPNLTSADYQNINSIWSWLTSPSNRTIEGLSVSQQLSFYNNMSQVLQNLQQAGVSDISNLTNQITKLEIYEHNLQQTYNQMQQIQILLQQLVNQKGSISQSKLLALLDEIQLLKGDGSKLPPADQAQLNKFLSSINSISFTFAYQYGNVTVQLGQLLGDLVLNQWIQQYFSNANNPKTQSGLLNYLKQQMQNSQWGSDPLSQTIMNELNGDIANISSGNYYSASLGQIMGTFLSGTSPNLSPSASFANGIIFLIQEDSTTENNGQAVLSSMKNFMSYLTRETSLIPQEIQGLKLSVSDILSQLANWKSMYNQVQALYVFTESLPDAFSNAILNHYMPGQEAYMEELAMILSFDNLGASMNNAILSDISNFNNASVHYDFNNWIQGENNGKGSGGNSQFSISGTQAKAKISTEQQQASADANSTQQAINSISQQQANIQQQLKQGKITKSQAAVLQNQLASEKTSLLAAQKNIAQLQKDLATLKSNVENQGNPVTISNTELNGISNDENAVINGGAGGVGGLSSIFNQVTANAQAWGGQSQTAQMQVQLVMTEMQQEWSVVTTAMQLLNQSYMTVAQNINR